MEKLKRTALLLLAALLCLSLAACNKYGDYPKLIVGTWDNNSVPDRIERYSFAEDGSGHYAIIQNDKEVFGNDFEYSVEENILTLRPKGLDETATHTLSFDDNEMTLTQGKATHKFVKQ